MLQIQIFEITASYSRVKKRTVGSNSIYNNNERCAMNVCVCACTVFQQKIEYHKDHEKKSWKRAHSALFVKSESKLFAVRSIEMNNGLRNRRDLIYTPYSECR